MPLHSALTGTNNHVAHAFTYADATARDAATGLAGSDVGKIALQSDDGSFWILLDDSPVTWERITKGCLRLVLDATAGLVQGVHAFGATLPDNAIVTKAWYDVVITFTSATDAATIELGINTDDTSGIVAAIAISNGANPWDSGLHDAVPDGTAANMTTKTTGRRAVQADVQVEDLTNGMLILFVEYVISG